MDVPTMKRILEQWGETEQENVLAWLLDRRNRRRQTEVDALLIAASRSAGASDDPVPTTEASSGATLELNRPQPGNNTKYFDVLHYHSGRHPYGTPSWKEDGVWPLNSGGHSKTSKRRHRAIKPA